MNPIKLKQAMFLKKHVLIAFTVYFHENILTYIQHKEIQEHSVMILQVSLYTMKCYLKRVCRSMMDKHFYNMILYIYNQGQTFGITDVL